MGPPHRARSEALERAPEVLVPDGVDGGVEETVTVTQPQYYTHHIRGHLASCTERENRRQQKERQPTEHEPTNDESQSACRTSDSSPVAALRVRSGDSTPRKHLW